MPSESDAGGSGAPPPRSGLRIRLDRTEVGTDRGVRYRGELLSTSLRKVYGIEIGATGEVFLKPDPAGETIPPGIEDLLRAVVRTVARHARAVDPPAWPRRVNRWHKLPSSR